MGGGVGRKKNKTLSRSLSNEECVDKYYYFFFRFRKKCIASQHSTHVLRFVNVRYNWKIPSGPKLIVHTFISISPLHFFRCVLVCYIERDARFVARKKSTKISISDAGMWRRKGIEKHTIKSKEIRYSDERNVWTVVRDAFNTFTQRQGLSSE